MIKKTLIATACLLLGYFVVVVAIENTPQKRKIREYAQNIVCISNLEKISDAKNNYARDKSLTNGANISLEDLTRGGYLSEYPVCPKYWTIVTTIKSAENSYNINPIGVLPTCRCDPVLHFIKREIESESDHSMNAR